MKPTDKYNYPDDKETTVNILIAASIGFVICLAMFCIFYSLSKLMS